MVLISGCTTFGDGVSENIPELKNGRGLVVFSTTAFEVSTFFPVGLTLVNGENHKRYDKVVLLINSSAQKSSFSNIHSTVRALELPIGKYYLIGWHPNPYETTTKSPVFEFEVSDKNITYIGNIYYNGSEIVWSANHKARDLAFFLSKNPSFSNENIEDQDITTEISFKNFRVKGIIFSAP